MSYINKVESDYDKNILSLKEVSELREEYNSLSVTDKLELDLKSKIEVKEVKSKISEENIMKKQFEFNEDVGGLFVNMLACYVIIIFTLGIGTPWAFCKLERWKANNTSIEGRKIVFIGEGSALLGKFILWYILTIITLGIYSFWMITKLEKFKVENTVFVD